ncbi:MAG: peptide-methionine (S)-S-oxide reductase MsrA [Steroidobacteraceae bacterium]
MTASTHFVNAQALRPPFAPGLKQALFGLGCFWGAERLFWELPGVVVTAVGYAGGTVADPDYKLVCAGRTNHAEVVLVVYDPAKISYDSLLKAFWEHHDPTQGNRQGNDHGTQYRSVIFCYDDAQLDAAEQSRELYQAALHAAGRGRITTQIGKAPPFYYAEEYHQQYLAKNPDGYCGLGGCGIRLDSSVSAGVTKHQSHGADQNPEVHSQ